MVSFTGWHIVAISQPFSIPGMMVVWLVIVAVLLYVLRALSRPKVDGEQPEPATVGQANPVAASAEVDAGLPAEDVVATRKTDQTEIEPFPMTPTKDYAPSKEPETPTNVGWRPDSPAPSESTLSADMTTPEARTLSLQSSPSGSHTVDAAGLPPTTPRSTGDGHAFTDFGTMLAPSEAGSVNGDDAGPKSPLKRGMSFKLKMGRTQSDAERLAKYQAKQAAEAERVLKVQQKEAAAEARSASRLAAAQALIAQKEAARQEADAQRQIILDQMAQQERHRQAMRDAQAAVDRAANTSALMGQVARQQAGRERLAQKAAANVYLKS